MSTTWITMTKIAGRLAEAVEQLLSKWTSKSALKEYHWSMSNSIIADGQTITSMYTFLEELELNAACPSVIFFEKYLDSWTIAPSLVAKNYFARRKDMLLIKCDHLDILLFTNYSSRSLRRSLQRLLTLRHKYAQMPDESYQFISRLRDCVTSCQTLLESNKIPTIIIIFFSGLGPSRLDKDILDNVTKNPAWFRFANS